MQVIIIDNYDSFTFNLVHYLQDTGVTVSVFRNDAIGVSDVSAMSPGAIVISPGPGRPENAGISVPLIREVSGQIPILGVCLGHQAIARAFGGTIISARRIMHGKTSVVTADGTGIFAGMTPPVTVMRYHSLAVQEDSLPDCLEVTARSEDTEIMGIRHREHPTEGVQFHPESFMTPAGMHLIHNFIRQASCFRKKENI